MPVHNLGSCMKGQVGPLHIVAKLLRVLVCVVVAVAGCLSRLVEQERKWENGVL